jgi:hypothetical protein
MVVKNTPSASGRRNEQPSGKIEILSNQNLRASETLVMLLTKQQQNCARPGAPLLEEPTFLKRTDANRDAQICRASYLVIWAVPSMELVGFRVNKAPAIDDDA